MKKRILFFVLLLLCAKAPELRSQTDGFFKSTYSFDESRSNAAINYSGSAMINPLSPESVPMGGGLSVLVTMALAYVMIRKEKNYE